MLISVLVTTYNRAAMLPVAIASIARQRCDAEIDILIVDDGSSDDTPAVIAELARTYPNLRHVRQDNAGIAAARNTALANLLPETDFVTFLDSDDAMPEGRLAADLPHLLADPALELTYARLMAVETIDPAELAPPRACWRREGCVPQLSLALFRRSLIDRIGQFDEALLQAEDTDYLLRIFETGTRFLQTETIALYYRRHPGNITANRAEMQRSFAAALLRSSKRRRADPTRVLRTPGFTLAPPALLE